jgi:hypothetical protein
MKILFSLALAGMLALGSVPASADIVIKDDDGGIIVDYVRKYEDIRSSGEKVVISGYCASACTLFLGMLPKQQFCFERGSKLGFHSASAKLPDGSFQHASEFSQLMFNLYPPKVRRIVKRLGWDGDKPQVPHPDLVWASGKLLSAMGPYCSDDLK